MMHLIKQIAISAILFSTFACGPMIDSLKYMATGKEGEVPPRTMEAAKAQFKDDDLKVGSSTENDLKALLGSPAEVRKVDGNIAHIYLKNVSTKGVSVDVGTIYTAIYTFAKDGKLKDKTYTAAAMGNALTNR